TKDKDIWVLREAGSSFIAHLYDSKPEQLTTGPIGFGLPVSSSDGKKLFVRGTQPRAELVRYDSRTKRFVPYLSWISVGDVDISRDGMWVTYVTLPENTLWRSKLDGTDRLQLTFPPTEALLPRWSPDGKQIVFADVRAKKPGRIFLVPSVGGSVHEILAEDKLNKVDPTWWPDGNSIVFGRFPWDPRVAIYRVDLRNQEVSELPGSEGMTSPRVSPDGRYLVASSKDWTKLMLHNFRTKKWSELAR